IAVERTRNIYFPGTQTIPGNTAVNVLNRSHSITADVEIPKVGAEGVLVSHGGNDAGYSLYVQSNKLCYVHNYVGRSYYRVISSSTLPVGRHLLRFEFAVTGKPDIKKGKGASGQGKLFIDGKMVGQEDIPVTTPIILGLTGGLTAGADPGSPVTPDYKSPFKFTGRIYSVTVDVSEELNPDIATKKEAKMRMAMARQ
ncbi:MAG: hypothetical protein WCY82_09585, partial [Desulfotomaculaceae bacterium]